MTETYTETVEDRFDDPHCGDAGKYRRAALGYWNDLAAVAMRIMILTAPVFGDGNYEAYASAESHYNEARRMARRFAHS